jgi:hypothetical protein
MVRLFGFDAAARKCPVQRHAPPALSLGIANRDSSSLRRLTNSAGK